MTSPVAILERLRAAGDPLRKNERPEPDPKIHLVNISLDDQKRGVRPYRVPDMAAIEHDAPAQDIVAIRSAVSVIRYCATLTGKLADEHAANNADETRSVVWRLDQRRIAIDRARGEVATLDARAASAIEIVHALRGQAIPMPTEANVTLRHIELRAFVRGMSKNDRLIVINEALELVAKGDRGAHETLLALATAPAIQLSEYFGTETKTWLERIAAAIDPIRHWRAVWCEWAFDAALDAQQQVGDYLDTLRAGALPGAQSVRTAPDRTTVVNSARR